MTQSCRRSEAINPRQHMRAAWCVMQATAATVLLLLGASGMTRLLGEVSADFFVGCFWTAVALTIAALVGAPLYVFSRCWREARRWDKEHRS